MRQTIFYQTASGRRPVEEFLDSLNDKQVKKVLWVLRIVRDMEFIPKEYFEKLKNTQDIWEVRITFGNNIFRILGFFDIAQIIVLTNGFAKKSQKTPRNEIILAEQRKKDYFGRKKHG